MGKETENNDEIEIDFGKITKFFKSKNKEKSPEVQENKEESGKQEESEDENPPVDLKSVSKFFKKYGIFFLILIPIFLSIFLRVQPAYLPITDQWATDTIINSISSQVRNQINSQYPNLPDENKNALIDSEMQKILKDQKQQIDYQVYLLSNEFKNQLRNPYNTTYLLEIDPYFCMRKTMYIKM